MPCATSPSLVTWSKRVTKEGTGGRESKGERRDRRKLQVQ